MTFIPFNHLLIVPADIRLADALAQAERQRQVVFGLEDGHDLYLVWASELMDQAWEAADHDVDRQAQILRRVYRSSTPAVAALQQAGLLPAAAVRTPAVERFEAITSTGEIERDHSPAARSLGIDVDDAATRGWGAALDSAYRCRWVCESRLHQWSCAKSGRPATCNNGRVWKKELF